MKPVLDGRIGWEDEKGYWVFEVNTRAGKEGTPLPYKPSIPTAPGWLIMKKVKLKLCDSGLELVFSKTMKPVFDGRIGWEDEKGYWIFEGKPRAGR